MNGKEARGKRKEQDQADGAEHGQGKSEPALKTGQGKSSQIGLTKQELSDAMETT